MDFQIALQDIIETLTLKNSKESADIALKRSKLPSATNGIFYSRRYLSVNLFKPQAHETKVTVALEFQTEEEEVYHDQSIGTV